PTQAPPAGAPQIDTLTQREELGNTASSQLPPASTPAGPSRGRLRGRPRGRPRGRAGTGRGGESHVNNSGVSKPLHGGGRGRGRPGGSGRGAGRGEAYSSMEGMMSSWQA